MRQGSLGLFICQMVLSCSVFIICLVRYNLINQLFIKLCVFRIFKQFVNFGILAHLKRTKAFSLGAAKICNFPEFNHFYCASLQAL